MRRLLIVLCLFALPLPALAAPRVWELRAGDSVFWTGPHVESSSGTESWTYRIRVTESAYRLRVGLDHAEVEDYFSAQVRDPKGAMRTIYADGGIYSAELEWESPEPGVWEIQVTADRVEDSSFRLRAKLEARPPSLGSKKGPVLPNLQVLPPHEASFLMPVTNGTVEDSIGVDLLGRESCHPEEHAEEQAVRCLRFAFGIRNTGLGPLDLFNSGPTLQDHELIQRVQRADGSYFERSAGVARFHKTHGHYHHHDAVALQLFKVLDPKRGEMEAAGEKHFKGFAHRDELLRDWDRFYPVWNKAGFGLLPGWADIYEWDRPGNYIDFGLNGDGDYLVRMWADPVKGVLESNELDNQGYTYLRVSGNEIELLEAGRGSDPWDPCKIEVGFGGHPDPRQAGRPSGCPPDTV